MRKKLNLAALAAVACYAVSGCTLLNGPINRAADRTAAAVNLYCDNFTPDQRLDFGDRVRLLAAPDSIIVNCG